MGEIVLDLAAARPPDGTTSNVPPPINTYKGSNTAPSRTGLLASFDAAADRVLWWNFHLPADYSSGGTLNIHWAANATTGNCVWSASVAAITPGDAVTYLAKAQATAASVTTATNGTAYRVTSSAITLTMDSAAASDHITLCVFRDADNGSDTLAVAAELLDGVSVTYTSA